MDLPRQPLPIRQDMGHMPPPAGHKGMGDQSHSSTVRGQTVKQPKVHGQKRTPNSPPSYSM